MPLCVSFQKKICHLKKCLCHVYIYAIALRDDTQMTSMKTVLFLRHPTILVHLRVKFFHSPDLRRPVSSEILTDPANHDQLNQLIKKNIIQ